MRYNKFLNNAIGASMLNLFSKAEDGFTFNISTDEVYTTAGDGYWSEAVKDVRVTDIGMFVTTVNDADEGEEAEYCDADMYVLYDEATWDNATDGLIYTDSAFLANVQDKLRDVFLKMGINNADANMLAGSVSYSEQGMQDDGRVSLDAFEVADYLRNFYAKNTVLA
jgi:DNA-directed RNA polymerase alpha subunit